MSATPKFLVVGAGPAGKAVTTDLVKSFPSASITLVDARDKAYHTVAAPRALVSPEKTKPEDLFIPIADILSKAKNGRFVKGTVKEVREKEAELEDGTVVPFDYLVYAAGSRNNAPIKFPIHLPPAEVTKLQRQVSAALASAKDILVVGAGPNGLEFTFELVEKYGRSKKITLVHSGKEVLSTFKTLDPKVRQVAMQKLQEAGVDVILGEKLEIPEDLKTFSGNFARRTLKTDTGRQLTSDVQLILTGNHGLNSEPMSRLSPPVVNNNGEIEALETLQVKGHPHMFVFGDVSSQSRDKQIGEQRMQVSVLSANIKSVVAGQPAAKHVKPLDKNLVLITTGTGGGFGQIPGVGSLYGFLGRNMIRMVKGKDLFLGSAWKEYTGHGIP